MVRFLSHSVVRDALYRNGAARTCDQNRVGLVAGYLDLDVYVVTVAGITGRNNGVEPFHGPLVFQGCSGYGVLAASFASS